MQQHGFGRLPPVSTLTLGGGGLGMLWGETTFEECVATVHAAVAAGITLFDLAPRYGDGKAEEVVGAAFAGQLPAGVRVTSKCNLGNAPAAEIETLLRQSIDGSLKRLRLSRLDLFFLHSNVVPDATHFTIVAPAAVNTTQNGQTVFPLVAPPLVRSGNSTVQWSTYSLNTTDTGSSSSLSQTPLNAATVFNFFFPDYKFQGALAAAGLTTPESRPIMLMTRPRRLEAQDTALSRLQHGFESRRGQ